MQKQIKEIQDYFKQKILNNEFEIKEIRPHVMEILVDREYRFSLWISNYGCDNYLTLFSDSYNFIDFIFSAEEKEKLHNIVIEPIKNYRKNILIKELEEELKLLKDE